MPDVTTVAPVSLSRPGGLRILWRCLGYLRPRWRLVVGYYAADAVTIILTLLIPQFIRWIVDRGIRGGETRLLGWAVLGLLGLTLVKGVFTFLMGYWTEIASQGVAFDLREAIHRKLSSLSFAYHDQARTGQLLSRAIQDVEIIRFLTGRAIMRTVEGGAIMLGTAVMLVIMNPRLAVLALLAMPLLVHRSVAIGRVLRPLSTAIQQQLGVITEHLEQNLQGARVVKAFAQEDAEIARFDVQNGRWFELARQDARLRSVNMPTLDFITSLCLVGILWYGGTLVIGGQLTLGELVAFTTYLGQLAPSVRRLGTVIPAIAQAMACGERIFEILDANPDVQDAAGAVPLPPARGHVRFEHVSFTYMGRHHVLHDIGLEAQPGQIVALLGPTGSGKSTIINLIPRFYDPTAGRVTIDGRDLRRVTLNSLRDQIGLVLQGTTLFAATIRENIAFGRPGATDEEIRAAAEAAQAAEFIEAMPAGYDTLVGERGVTLSGGQKQRVAIARALLKDPRILILDDALSAVDTETEHLIQRALERLMQGRTSFVIAQRLSTMRMADLILVLDKGRIAARGTHEELLRTNAMYAEIYERQLRPQEETARPSPAARDLPSSSLPNTGEERRGAPQMRV